MNRQCKDCEPGSKRPAPHPGPRCATHHRQVAKERKADRHEKRVQAVYGLSPGDYEKLYEGQGGTCWICRRATGKVKRLAVDHDHKTGRVRGLLCGVCNQLIGHLRDSVETARRIADYLADPPAPRILAGGSQCIIE